MNVTKKLRLLALCLVLALFPLSPFVVAEEEDVIQQVFDKYVALTIHNAVDGLEDCDCGCDHEHHHHDGCDCGCHHDA